MFQCCSIVCVSLSQPSRLQQIQIQPELHGGFNTGIGMVAVTDTGCSPLRPRLNSFIGYNQVLLLYT